MNGEINLSQQGRADCILDEQFKTPPIGLETYVQVLVKHQVKTQYDEFGDVIEITPDLIQECREESGLQLDPIDEGSVLELFQECIALRYTGNCTAARCNGYERMTKRIEQAGQKLAL